MHCGASNPKIQYTMTQDNVTKPLEETCQEKDLGVMVTNTLKPTLHCMKAGNKGMSALKLLQMAFGTINKRNFKPLYKAYVRPHLEYCSQAVGAYMVQDFNALEKEQRRATKLVQVMRNLPYGERLRRLDLCSVVKRVLRGDLIETFKIMTGTTRLDSEPWLTKLLFPGIHFVLFCTLFTLCVL